MGRPVVHWELWSNDPTKVSDFYQTVFGWTVKHVPDLNYWVVETGGEGGINGGIMRPQDGPWPGNMCFYVKVDDLASYLTKVEAAGGKTLVPRMEVPGVGALALFEDPDGRVTGIWE
jgi:predicted enzyme related to lactoylglutathione lyase